MFVITDSSGMLNAMIHEVTLSCISKAGVQMMNWFVVVGES